MTQFSDQLKKLLKERRISQQSLSDVVGVSKTTINSWCNGGSIDLDNAVKIADYLGVTLDYLVLGKLHSYEQPTEWTVAMESEIAYKNKRLLDLEEHNRQLEKKLSNEQQTNANLNKYIDLLHGNHNGGRSNQHSQAG